MSVGGNDDDDEKIVKKLMLRHVTHTDYNIMD